MSDGGSRERRRTTAAATTATATTTTRRRRTPGRKSPRSQPDHRCGQLWCRGDPGDGPARTRNGHPRVWTELPAWFRLFLSTKEQKNKRIYYLPIYDVPPGCKRRALSPPGAGRDLGRVVRALRWGRATRVTPREWGAGVPGGARADYGTAAARYKAAGTEAPERTHGAERTTRAPVGTRATRAKRATTAAGGGDSRAGGCEQERDVGQTALHGVRGVSSTALPVHLACGVVTGAGAVHRFDGGPCGAHRPSVACDLPRRMRRAARRRRGLRHRHL